MANHCIDVVCASCGREWCVRGCRYADGPSPARAVEVRADVEADGAGGRRKRLRYAADRCQCGSKEVFSA